MEPDDDRSYHPKAEPYKRRGWRDLQNELPVSFFRQLPVSNDRGECVVTPDLAAAQQAAHSGVPVLVELGSACCCGVLGDDRP